MDHRLIEGLMEAVVPLICDHVDEKVAAATGPLLARIAELEGRAAPKDGKDADPEMIERLVNEAVARIPQAAPGKDADPELVAALVDKAVAALDIKGQPGTSVTVNDVAPMILEAVGKAVEAIEVPQPDMALIGLMVDEKVEASVAALPSPQPGEPGKSVTVQELVPMVADEVRKAVEALDLPQLDPATIDAAVEIRLAAWDRPKDGKSVSLEDVAPMVASEVDKAVSAIPTPKDGVGLAGALIDRDGQLVVTMTDGSSKALGVVVGKDVDMDRVLEAVHAAVAEIPRPKDGLDGVGFDDMSVVDEDGAIVLRFQRGDVMKSFPLPVTVDRGVWTDGAYRKGAGVTWGGSYWIAQRDTKTKPDTTDSDWRLSVKKGRNGKDGEPGKPGPRGEQGKQGERGYPGRNAS